MGAYLLTWNPNKYAFNELPDLIDSLVQGKVTKDRWSCGVTRRIGPGDRLFLMRLGEAPKGIVGLGIATGKAFTDKDWDGSRATANFIPVEWEALIDPSVCLPLPLESLEEKYPRFTWTPQASGISIPDDIARDLDDMFQRHLEVLERKAGLEPGRDLPARVGDPETATARRGGSGQGRGLTPAERTAVERYAEDCAIREFEKEGFKVTKKGKPYDLLCTRPGRTLYVEVKGTTTRGEKVILTKNEVAFAREHGPDMVLYIRSDVELTGRKGNPSASGGAARIIRPWDVDKGTLEASQYEYEPPEE